MKLYEVTMYQIRWPDPKDATGRPHEERHTFVVEADSFKDAAAGGYRWWKGRKAILPMFYDTLTCVNVHGFTPGRINEMGDLPVSRSLSGFEWKYDWGYTMEQALEGAEV